MSSEIKKVSPELDGFAGFSDQVEGEDTQSGSGVSLLGTKLKYLAPTWTDPDEQEITGPLVVHDIQRKVQKWLDDTRPTETLVLAAGEPWPDIAAMNAECPQSEWREKFGKLQGPWQGEHVVLFFDPETMMRFWWPSPTATIGSAICVRELVAQTKLVRSYRGAHVYPLVELSHTFMSTNYGDRERPSLIVKSWVSFGGGDKSLPVTQAPALTKPEAAQAPSTQPPQSGMGMRTVDPPSAKEVTGDEIPTDRGESSSDRKVLSPRHHKEPVSGGTIEKTPPRKAAAPRRARRA
jgi:hypothetical protein